MSATQEPSTEEAGRHLACTVTAGIIGRVRGVAGEGALGPLLSAAGSERSLAYLEDITNWVSRDEVIALFEAGAEITGDPQIARRVGENAIRQYSGTPVATTLRSLGSVEEMLRQIAIVASKFSAISDMEVVDVEPGCATVLRRSRNGFEGHRLLCDWVLGLLASAPGLYGIPAAAVEELECQGGGAERCLLRVSWDSALAARTADPAEHITTLEAQLTALEDSLEKMYAVAGDLIGDHDLEDTLAKITERSASAVRAPRHLLVVTPHDEAEPQIHRRGLSEEEALHLAEQVLQIEPEAADVRWLLADVRSHRRFYGRIAALFDEPHGFFPRERRTLEHYARYAANALDHSIALAQARRGHAETRALLDFARSLSGASSHTVAERLAQAIPHLVDCDRVAVFLEHGASERLTCVATHGYPAALEEKIRALEIRRGQTDLRLGEELFGAAEPRPLFYLRDTGSPFVQEMFKTFGAAALALVPIMVGERVLGAIGVAVTSQPARLHESRELHDRLSGIVAQAAVGLENGELIDRISHQARHDPLTGLVNRTFFAERFEQALAQARAAEAPLGLFYVDLDGFKAVNDEHGHATGDELLCQVGVRLLEVIRAQDTVARLGGDEFAIIVHEAADRSQVEAAAERVASAFVAPFQIGGLCLSIGASVGRAVWPYDAEELDQLMRRADASMYRSKRGAAAGAS